MSTPCALVAAAASPPTGPEHVDEPTELPEGTEIELVPVDDGFDPEEPGARSIPAADVVTSVFGAVVDATAGVRL